MSIDMSQFHQVFFEESFEGLDIMETGLMDLDLGSADDEEINTIFRAAHSIKGGAGTFGFTDVASFTHVMETLLDEMRDGARAVTREGVDLLLLSVDCLREMLSAVDAGEEIDQDAKNELQKDLETLLASNGSGSDAGSSSMESSAVASKDNEVLDRLWKITFTPHSHLFTTGNDPVKLFHELEHLGAVTAAADLSNLPSYEEFNPEESYLSWGIDLQGECSEADILEIFEWVDEDCDLSIIQMGEQWEIESPAVQSTTESELGLSKPEVNATAEATVTSASPTPDATTVKKKPAKNSASESSSIRVGTDKIDTLINMVGELVITQSMLSQVSENFQEADIERLKDGISELERNTRELQENVMQIRMLPISFSFNRFPRLVRDLATKLGKNIELKLTGETTELDKSVMEKIGDPLVHLVRNSLDHGIEMPEVRKAAGKSEVGTINLNAFHEGGNIVIEIIDDGAGLNKERILSKARENGLVGENEVLPDEKIHELIFAPGFSTATEVSDVSGRGVGMDVVMRNIRDLGGKVEIKSEIKKGSTFTIRLPLTLAILDGQLIRVGKHVFIIPLISIVESLQIEAEKNKRVAGKAELYKLRDEYISVLRLHDIFNITPDSSKLEDGLLVVAEADGQKVGLFVDDLLSQQQVVIKSLETNYEKVDGISGATILGDGTVSMILDLSGVMRMYTAKPAQKNITKEPVIEGAVA
ncbi:MAG: chemotaxis protein CheA [Gammaproteobacteria bacterium]